MTKIVIDTNVLLDDADIIFKLSKKYDKVVIPLTVLRELDKHKFNPDLSYSARNAIYSIVNFKKTFPDKLVLSINDNEISSNDDKILKTAVDSKADIATKDLSMSVIADTYGINTVLYDTMTNGVFNPYIYIDILDVVEGFDYQQNYKHAEFVSKTNIKVENGYWKFIFIKSNDKVVYVYATNPKNGQIVRIDNETKYREITNKKIELRARDNYQIAAIYALKTANNVLLTGPWGSAKSLLSTAYALTSNSNKTFVSRPPIGTDSKYNIGYLPGTAKEKLMGYAMGFLSSLYYFYGNTKNQVSDGKSYDFVKDELFDRVFQLIDINSLQGLSLLDDVLLLDEVQYMSIDLMSNVLSRATNDTNIILTGDLKQGYGIRPSNSGLLKLLRVLPHHSMAYVDLKHSYRSDLLELAEKLQNNAL